MTSSAAVPGVDASKVPLGFTARQMLEIDAGTRELAPQATGKISKFSAVFTGGEV
jgi:hypothetical protein